MIRKIFETLMVIFMISPIASMAQQAPQSPCKTEPEYRQFDFWIGEWEVKNPNDVVVGNSKIELTVGDCVLLENWSGASGYTGKSLSYYNLYDKKWHQKWIGSGGIPVEFKGEYNAERNSMDYTGKGIGTNGEELAYRFTFFHLSDDYVRQLWEQSSDEGETWTTLFDGHYRRK